MGNDLFAKRAYAFYSKLKPPRNLPRGIRIIHPFHDEAVKQSLCSFLSLYYTDNRRRTLVLGINPGRFGSGVTGIPFTDPIRLDLSCGISNEFAKVRELSSEFIYRFIDRWGGTRRFYGDFFLSAVSPIGFTLHGANYNYYDDDELYSLIGPFIRKALKQQTEFCGRDSCILLGSGKNLKAFTDINAEMGLFKNVFALEHPRYIMQYKRKQIERYLDKYEEVFIRALNDR